MIFKTDIPIKVKHLVIDINWNNNFIFESMDCQHSLDAKEHIKVDCIRCKFDKQEFWLEKTLSEINPTEESKEKNETFTLSKIIVVRGKYDDCIAIQKEFS